MEQVSHRVEDDDPPYCEICGTELTWIECWQSLGDGEFDLYEEDPIFFARGQKEGCDECQGKGGWMGCEMSHDSAQGKPE